jgi:hypothetical protein
LIKNDKLVRMGKKAFISFINILSKNCENVGYQALNLTSKIRGNAVKGF